MSFERNTAADGAGGPADLPGFSRGEGLFLGLAAVAIGLWGSLGIDFDSARISGPAPEPGSATTSAAALPEQLPQPESHGAERGRQLFEEYGCSSCHALAGPPSVGPSLRGIWGTRQALADGSSVVVDRSYFEESVLRPGAGLVRGYEPAMPSYEGLLGAGDLEALADYISGLK